MHRLTLRIRHHDCWAAELGARFPDLRLFIRNTVPTGVEAMDILYARRQAPGAGDFEALLAFLRAHPRVRGVEVLDRSEDALFLLVKSGGEKTLIEAISRAGAFVLKPTLLEGGREVWTLGMVRRETGRALVEDLSKHGEVEVLALGRDEFDSLHLTPMQRAALDLAVAEGYYTFPRRITPTELAAKMGLAKSTFLEHLHKAEEKVMGAYFESF